MPNRPQWVLADPHAGQDAEADDALLRVIQKAAAAQADLLIMGDLFVAWLAPERFWTPRQRPVLEAIRAVRTQGGRTRFVVGNRDYLVPTLQGSVFDVVYTGEVVTEVAGQLTLLSHGDGLNPNDRPYLAWRALSRSPAITRLLHRLPAGAGQALAQRTERQMAGVNKQYKSGDLPQAQLQALGERAKARGAVQALVGHFHHDCTIAVPEGAPVICVPGWCEHQRLLVADAEGRLQSVAFD
jgi:UDP-2,3-diacylglucosamine hydrolase